MTKLGILHPGQMGISVAASAQKSGCKVYWVSENRSEQTRKRALDHNLEDAHTLKNLCHTCDVVVSVCPPAAAENVANQVITSGFKGVYLDANAISPQRSKRIGRIFRDAGLEYIDGGIIGGPAWVKGRTWLYISGKQTQIIDDCFSNGPLEVSAIGDDIGKASALKMCFAAYTKGTTALLSGILAAAEALDVREELETQWARGDSDFAEQTKERVRHVTAKAWRFEGEMGEISSTLANVNIPGEFHSAAAEIYRRIALFKDSPETPELPDVIAALLCKHSNE